MIAIVLFAALTAQQEVPGGKPLDAADGNTRSVAMVAGIDKFLTRKTAEISADRRKRWEAMVAKPGFPDREKMRTKLRTALGLKSNQKRKGPSLDLVGTTDQSARIAESNLFTVDRV